MSTPAFLLSPGSFAAAEFYATVMSAVTAAGYSIEYLDLPSIAPTTAAPKTAPPTMYDDAVFIAEKTRRLADEGRDVVLIGHSYGGVPAIESTKGMSKEERAKHGLKGGIVKLAFITSLVPPVGVSGGSLLATVPEEQRSELKADVCLFLLSHDSLRVILLAVLAHGSLTRICRS